MPYCVHDLRFISCNLFTIIWIFIQKNIIELMHLIVVLLPSIVQMISAPATDDHLESNRFNSTTYIYSPHNRLMVFVCPQINIDMDFILGLSLRYKSTKCASVLSRCCCLHPCQNKPKQIVPSIYYITYYYSSIDTKFK